MAKKGGMGGSMHSREVMVWSITMLTLAISCVALSVLIQQNGELQDQVDAYAAQVQMQE